MSTLHAPFFNSIVRNANLNNYAGKLWALELPPMLNVSYIMTARIDDSACNDIYKNTIDANKDKDPDSPLIVDKNIAYSIERCLSYNDFVISSERSIQILSDISWNSQYSLFFVSKNSVVFEVGSAIKSLGRGSLSIKSGINNPEGIGKVEFRDQENKQVIMEGGGDINIYYNPDVGDLKYKYHNPTDFSAHIEPIESLNAFMLVNNANDLQNISFMLHASFALSQDVVLHDNQLGTNGNLLPITRFSKMDKEQRPFSGTFNGNGYTIKGLVIKFPSSDKVGLFSFCSGTPYKPVEISDVVLSDCFIEGNLKVGAICGVAQYANISNVELINCKVHGNSLIGGVVGVSMLSTFDNVTLHNTTVTAEQTKGLLAGAATENLFVQCSQEDSFLPLVGQDMDTNIFER